MDDLIVWDDRFICVSRVHLPGKVGIKELGKLRKDLNP